MKIRSAAGGFSTAALALLVALGGAACGKKDESANNSNAAGRNANAQSSANANHAPVATSPPETASQDTAIKNKTEANLSKYGVTGVTVEVNEGVITLKGDVPAAKFQDAVKAANEAGARRVMNQLNKK